MDSHEINVCGCTKYYFLLLLEGFSEQHKLFQITEITVKGRMLIDVLKLKELLLQTDYFAGQFYIFKNTYFSLQQAAKCLLT